MSWRASAWAKEQRLGSPAAKSILLCLADYADPEKASCWPSQAQLADDAEVSERTAREWLQRLEDWGLLSRERRTRPNGARASDIIVLNLAATVRDGADRCREIKACESGDDDSLPANSAGRPYRQPDAEPTGNEQQPTGNQCRAYKEEPSIEPSSLTSQPRDGAGERGEDGLRKGDDGKAVETAFWRLVKDWPQFAGMPKQAALRGWLKLSAQDRQDAEARLPGWLALLKAQKKDHVPAPSTYFGQRLWSVVPDPSISVAAGPHDWAPPFGPVWGAWRIDHMLKGPDHSHGISPEERWPLVAAMHRKAKFRQGLRFAEKWHTEEIKRSMEAVPVGSPVFEAWRDLHERRGWPWLPDPGVQRVVFFPVGGPEGLDAFAAAVRGSGNDGGQSQAAE